MGKRYLLLIIAALLVMPMAFAAITVTPNAPAADLTQSSSTVSFNCGATESDILYEISNISVYIDTVKNQTQSGDSLVLDVSNVPAGSHNWYCEAVNNASVSASSATRTFTISSANTAPQFSGPIPNQTFNEDATLSTAFDLDTYFTDTQAMAYSASGNSHITVTIAADGQVTFSSTGNWSGSEPVVFTASDGTLTNTSNTVNVSVTPVNDAPYYTTIPAQNMTKNTNKTITLSSYFFDVEGSTLNYTVSSAPSHMNVTISGSIATLRPEPNWTGTTSITFTASDGSASTAGNSVSLVVSAGATNTTNRKPVVGCNVGTGKVYLKISESKDLRITSKSDPDGNTLSVAWKVEGTVVDGETGDTYSFSKDAAGTYAVNAVVSDGALSETCVWSVEVSASGEQNYTSETGNIGSIIDQQTEEVARCGDGKIQEGENCGNCKDDVKCRESELCSENVCVPKTNTKTILIVIGAALAVIVGGGFAAYRITTKKGATTRVRDGRTLSQVEKELPSVDLHDLYQKEERPRADMHGIPSPHENPVQKYVRQMREKGVSDDEIIGALKSKGWKEEAIRQYL